MGWIVRSARTGHSRGCSRVIKLDDSVRDVTSSQSWPSVCTIGGLGRGTAPGSQGSLVHLQLRWGWTPWDRLSAGVPRRELPGEDDLPVG